MTPLATLFRVKPSSRKRTPSLAVPAPTTDSEWAESGWSFHDSSMELLRGVEVVEHPAPPNMASLLERFTAKQPAAPEKRRAVPAVS